MPRKKTLRKKWCFLPFFFSFLGLEGVFPASSGGTYRLAPVGYGEKKMSGERVVGIFTGGASGLTFGVGAGTAVTVGAGFGGMPLPPLRQDLA